MSFDKAVSGVARGIQTTPCILAEFVTFLFNFWVYDVYFSSDCSWDLERHVSFVRPTFGGLLLTFGCCDIWAERELSNGFIKYN